MKRPSIRSRLLLWSTVLMTVILITTGCFLYASLKESLYDQNDRLLDEAAIVAMIEVEVKDSLEQSPLQVSKALIQVWDYHSNKSVRSSVLGDFDLKRNYGKLGERIFSNLELPNGERGRAVGILVHPRVEYQEGNECFVPADHPQLFDWAQSAEGLHQILEQFAKTFLIGGASVIALLWGAIWLVIFRSSRAVMEVSKEVLAREGSEVGRPIPVPDKLPAEVAGTAQKFNELLLKINRSREKGRDFFLNVAHEICTPLAGDHAIVEQALRNLREVDDDRRRFEALREETSGLRALVNRLMRFGRLNKSGETLDNENVDLNGFLKRLWEAFRQKFSERQLSAEWDLEGKCVLESDPELLKVVLSNLRNDSEVN